MKKFKVLVSVFMVLVLIVSIFSVTLVTTNAEETAKVTDTIDTVEVDDEIYADENIKKPLNNDEKIFCNATVEDDFATDRLLIVLKNETSLNFDEYNTIDISELSKIKTKNIREITSTKSEKIYKDFDDKKVKYTKELEEITTSKIEVSTNALSAANTDNVQKEIIEKDALTLATNDIKKEYADFHKIISVELNTDSKAEVLNAVKLIEKNDSVLAVHPDYLAQPSASIANDTYFNDQWSIGNASIDDAWDITTGSSSVKVGVIDDGINRNHPDLSGNINTSLSTTFTDASPYVSLGGHGTMVAGIIGAVGNNSIGVSGVCWDVSLVSLQVMQSNKEYSTTAIVEAIAYAEDKNIDILNLSLNWKTRSIPSFEAALALYNGLIISSAGNNGANIDNTTSDNVNLYPSILSSSKIISVASIQEGSTSTLASNSNFGATSVDLAAPGELVYTTYDGNDLYSECSGTSLAAPQVAGVAALIKSVYPNITNLGLRRAILKSVDKVSALSGKVSTGGKLNAKRAFSYVTNCKYTVAYSANGGTGTMSNTIVTYGFYTPLRNVSFTKPYHNFAGWQVYKNSNNTYYYGKGSARKWFVEGTETSGYTKVVYENQKEIAHTTKVNGEVITMVATWEPYRYRITYDSNGADGSMNVASYEYDDLVTLSLNTYVYTGYTFGGWNAYKLDSNSNKLWLYSNGNTNAWYIKDSQPSGYELVNFSDGATINSLSNIDRELIRMFANWIPISYNIIYDANGGSGTMQNTVGYTNQSVQLRSNAFSKEHCRFKGWHIVDTDGYWNLIGNNWSNVNVFDEDKKLYEDGAIFDYVAEHEGVNVNAIAQWLLLGDVDLDGSITIIDVTIIQEYFAQLIELTEEQISHGDFNEDGSFNILDATAIQFYLAQMD